MESYNNRERVPPIISSSDFANLIINKYPFNPNIYPWKYWAIDLIKNHSHLMYMEKINFFEVYNNVHIGKYRLVKLLKNAIDIDSLEDIFYENGFEITIL